MGREHTCGGDLRGRVREGRERRNARRQVRVQRQTRLLQTLFATRHAESRVLQLPQRDAKALTCALLRDDQVFEGLA